jgi:hypothetical protein
MNVTTENVVRRPRAGHPVPAVLCLGLAAALLTSCLQPRTYTFELNFTGMVIFTLEGKDKHWPDAVNILLPTIRDDGDHRRAHAPLLTCEARDVVSISDHQLFKLFPSPDGSEVAWLDISTLHLRVVPPPTYWDKHLHLHWYASSCPREPASEDEEGYLDWVTPLRAVYPDLQPPSGTPPYYNLDDNFVTSTVHFTAGDFRGADFPLDHYGHHVVWRFKNSAPQLSSSQQALAAPQEQALAGRLVLTLRGLPRAYPVTIHLGTDAIQFKPPVGSYEDVVRVGISNFPQQQEDPSGKLMDYAALWSLVGAGSPGDAYLPEAENGPFVTTTSTYCPPGGHTD